MQDLTLPLSLLCMDYRFSSSVKINNGEMQIVTLVGNINETLDVWYRDISLPPLQEDDCIALVNAGAYSASVASNHCMCGSVKELLLY